MTLETKLTTTLSALTQDVESKLRTTQSIVDSVDTAAEAQVIGTPLNLCVAEVKDALNSIEIMLKEIHVELQLHQLRYMHKWRSSNVGSILERLQTKLAILEKRVDMLIKCKTISGTVEKKESRTNMETKPNNEVRTYA